MRKSAAAARARCNKIWAAALPWTLGWGQRRAGSACETTRQDPRNLAHWPAALLVPNIEGTLDEPQIPLGRGITIYDAHANQCADYVPRQNERVLAHAPEEELPRSSAKAATPPLQEFVQSDDVSHRPAGDEFTEAAVFPLDLEHETRIVPNAPEFLEMPDDARVLHHALYRLVGLISAGDRIEALKNFLETRPLVIHDPPDEARAENRPGHLCQITVAGECSQLGGGLGFREDLLECMAPALAAGGAGEDGVERFQIQCSAAGRVSVLGAPRASTVSN